MGFDFGPGQLGWIITGSGDQNVGRNGALACPAILFAGFTTPPGLDAIGRCRSEVKAPS